MEPYVAAAFIVGGILVAVGVLWCLVDFLTGGWRERRTGSPSPSLPAQKPDDDRSRAGALEGLRRYRESLDDGEETSSERGRLLRDVTGKLERLQAAQLEGIHGVRPDEGDARSAERTWRRLGETADLADERTRARPMLERTPDACLDFQRKFFDYRSALDGRSWRTG